MTIFPHTPHPPIFLLFRSKYKIPDRKRLNGDLLDSVAKTMEQRTSRNLKEYSNSHGFAIMADGATIHHVPLFNILAGSNGIVERLEIVSELCVLHASR